MSSLFHRAVYLLVATGLAFGLVQVLTNPVFQVTNLEIRGLHFLNNETVVKTSAVTGINAFRVSTSATNARLMALGVPERVTVRVKLPNSIGITISERPAAYLWKSGSTIYSVADDGTVLGPKLTNNSPVLVVDRESRPVEIGKLVDVRVLREAAYVMRTLPTVANLTPASVDFSQALGMVVLTPDNLSIIIGDNSDLATKLADAGPALFAARQARPTPVVIDLRSPRHPLFR